MAGQRIAATVARAAWRPLVDVDGSASGPVCSRQAHHLALADLGSNPHPRSSIMFPSHARASARVSFGLDPLDLLEPTDDASPAVVRLASDLQEFATLDLVRQAQVLSALNCLTEQALVDRLTPDLPALEKEPDAALGRVWYEVARGRIRLDDDRESADVLAVLLRSAPTRVAVAAGIQLAAYRLRIERDLTSAAEVLDATRQRVAEGFAPDPDPASAAAEQHLLLSRLWRVEALFATRSRELSEQHAAMEHAETLSRGLLGLEGQHPYDLLLALENHKIICEARVKAASFARDLEALDRWSCELIALDPEDPTSWRCVAEGAAMVGARSTARLALVGQAALGGLGVHRTLGLVEDERDEAQDAPGWERVMREHLGRLWAAE
jgi:hypothetical protein